MFRPTLATSRSWISWSRLAVGDPGVEVDGDEVRDEQAERAGDLAGEPLRDEDARALAGAPELHDVQPVVVGLDESGQRAALAERGDVAGRPDDAQSRRRRAVTEPASPDRLDRVRGLRDPVPCPDLRPDPGHPAPQLHVAEQPIDRAAQVGRRSKAYVGRRTPKPVSSTRWALSYWSQNSGSTTIGLPKWKASVVVLLPPWVITRSTSGTIVVCGRNSAPHMFGASSNSACCGPFETM